VFLSGADKLAAGGAPDEFAPMPAGSGGEQLHIDSLETRFGALQQDSRFRPASPRESNSGKHRFTQRHGPKRLFAAQLRRIFHSPPQAAIVPNGHSRAGPMVERLHANVLDSQE